MITLRGSLLDTDVRKCSVISYTAAEGAKPEEVFRTKA